MYPTKSTRLWIGRLPGCGWDGEAHRLVGEGITISKWPQREICSHRISVQPATVQPVIPGDKS